MLTQKRTVVGHTVHTIPWVNLLIGPGWLRESESREKRQMAQKSWEDSHYSLLVPTQNCPFRWGVPCGNAVLANMGETLYKLESVSWRNAFCCAVCRAPAAVLQPRYRAYMERYCTLLPKKSLWAVLCSKYQLIDAFLKETTAFCQHWHMETAALIFSMRESTADSEKYHFMVHGLSFALVHFTVLAAMQNNISC